MLGFCIKFINCNKKNGYNMRDKNTSKVFTIFIKAVLFQHFGFYWIIQPKEQLNIDSDKQCTLWIQYRPWRNTKNHICVALILICFTTFPQDRYALMCFIKVYVKLHETCSNSEIIIGVISLPEISTTDVLKSLCITPNFIDIMLQIFETN